MFKLFSYKKCLKDPFLGLWMSSPFSLSSSTWYCHTFSSVVSQNLEPDSRMSHIKLVLHSVGHRTKKCRTWGTELNCTLCTVHGNAQCVQPLKVQPWAPLNRWEAPLQRLRNRNQTHCTVYCYIKWYISRRIINCSSGVPSKNSVFEIQGNLVQLF